jgi:hypothetical protein
MMVNVSQQLEAMILHAERWTPELCGRKDRGIPCCEPEVELLGRDELQVNLTIPNQTRLD